MKPVLIFEHIESSNAGLFAEFLQEHNVPLEVIHPNQGDEIPGSDSLSAWSGLCFLGGTESVTSPTPAMVEEMALISSARELNLPMIGHCLGGQLISQALGGEVRKHDVEEFGWSTLIPESTAELAEWLPGPPERLVAMQWHSDSFSIPPGATKILGGEYCENQAFVDGNVLGMQFHIEINLESIRHWAIDLEEKHPPQSPSVQSGETIMSMNGENFPASRKIAWQLYSRWLEFL